MHRNINRALYFVSQSMRGERVASAYHELEKTTYSEAVILHDLQNARIKSYLEHAYKDVPFYRNKYKAYLHGIEKVPLEQIPALMQSIPVLGKSEILENYQEFKSDKNHFVHTNISSGTTGQPFAYPCDQISWAFRHASIMRFLALHAVRFGEPYGYFFGQHWKNELRLKTKAKDWFFNRTRFSAFSITGQNARETYQRFKNKKVTYFVGYPSTMVEFCKLCIEELKIDLRQLNLKLVMATGETLEDYQRAYLEHTLGCRVANYYGSAEGGAGAFEGPEGWMHENMETTHIEIQANGKLAKTDLFLRQFPMLKIATDDVCVPPIIGIKSKLGHRVLGKITGRTGEKIKLPDGREYHAVILDYFFDLFINHPEVLRFRFVFETSDVTLLVANKANAISHEFETELIREFKRLFGEVPFSVKCVEEIPLLPNGKHRPWVQYHK